MAEKKKTYVTKSFLPTIEEYTSRIQSIWTNNQLTNQGPMVQELEQGLAKHLGVDFLSVQSNGTLSLQIAIRALKLSGEIITTPFSYVATTNSILWEGCTPVFADIDPVTCCIDADKIPPLITEKTTGILATHVYGNPCEVEKIAAIAREYNLKVIYDAAHAFGVEYKGESILKWGDVSTLSFHATKLFHSIEGGATICQSAEVLNQLNLLRSFGHRGDDYFGLGINAKMSEFHAAMGLCVLPYVNGIMESRKQHYEQYRAAIKGSHFSFPGLTEGTTLYNYSYFPIIAKNAALRQEIVTALNAEGVFPRRYFYPSLNQLPHFSGAPCPVSENYAERVLCLPLFHDITAEEINRICDIINRVKE